MIIFNLFRKLRNYLFYYLETLTDSEHRDLESIYKIETYLNSLVFHATSFQRLLKVMSSSGSDVYNKNFKSLRKCFNEN